MKKITITLKLTFLFCISFAQKIIINTNGFSTTLKKIDTLFYEEVNPIFASNLKLPITSTVISKFNVGIIKKNESKFSSNNYQTSYYVYEDGTLQAPTSTLFFKPKNIQSFISKYKMFGKIEEHSVFKGYYYLYCNYDVAKNGNDIFELCNTMFRYKDVEIIEPCYNKLLKQNNPLFPIQWNLQNTGIVGGAIAGADMKVTNAWCISTGNNIKVAVIDDGVDLTHPDLQSNLLPGFDATGLGSGGGPEPINGHGTSCAGIIAAVNNTIGPIGVAYNSKIIPIRMGTVNLLFNVFQTSDIWISNSINEAVVRGADVISNSWGGGNIAVQINLALDNAVNNGRGGLGTVVLFSTGNANGNVTYPATRENVIAVGASTPCDTRKRSSNDPNLVNFGNNVDIEGVSCDGENWWGSNFGDNLDIVAPGVLIPTTDVQGLGGFTTSDYSANFNGTSAACPNAAGVAALILSTNPSLTGVQPRQVLERSCDKLMGMPNSYMYNNVANQPNGIWNNQVGYGRVNAYNALMFAQGFPTNFSIQSNYHQIHTQGKIRFIATWNTNITSSYTVEWYNSSTNQLIATTTGFNQSTFEYTPNCPTKNSFDCLSVYAKIINTINCITNTQITSNTSGGQFNCKLKTWNSSFPCISIAKFTQQLDQIQVTPNPTKNIARITLPKGIDWRGNYELLSTSTGIVRTGRLNTQNYFEINLTGLVSGIYTLNLRTKTELRQVKIIKE